MPAEDPNTKPLAELEEGFAPTGPQTDPNAMSLSEYFAKHGNEVQDAINKDQGRSQKETAPQPDKANEGKETEIKHEKTDAHAQKGNEQNNEHVLTDEEIEKLSPEGRSFGTLKKQLKLTRKEHAKLTEEIKALREQAKHADTPAELAAIKTELEDAKKQRDSIQKERDDLNEVFKSALYQHSPEFKQKYDGQKKMVMDLAKRTLSSDVFNKAQQILNMPAGEYRDTLLTQLGEELPAATRGRLDALALRIDEIELAREADAQDGARRYDEYIAQQQAQKKKGAEQAEAYFNDALRSITDPKNGIELFRPGNTPQSKTEVEEMIGVARRAWSGGMPAEQLATLQLWGAAFPNMLKRMETMAARIKDLETENTNLKGSTPSIRGTAVDKGGSEDKGPRENESLAEMINRLNPTGTFR